MSDMEDTVVTLDDVRRAGFCARGVWQYARTHGWSRDQFRDFARFGLKASELREMGDPGLVDRVLEAMQRRNKHGVE